MCKTMDFTCDGDAPHLSLYLHSDINSYSVVLLLVNLGVIENLDVGLLGV